MEFQISYSVFEFTRRNRPVLGLEPNFGLRVWRRLRRLFEQIFDEMADKLRAPTYACLLINRIALRLDRAHTFAARFGDLGIRKAFEGEQCHVFFRRGKPPLLEAVGPKLVELPRSRQHPVIHFTHAFADVFQHDDAQKCAKQQTDDCYQLYSFAVFPADGNLADAENLHRHIDDVEKGECYL